METIFANTVPTIHSGKIWNDPKIRSMLLNAAPFFFSTYYSELQICGEIQSPMRIALQFVEPIDVDNVKLFEQLAEDAFPLDIEIDWDKSIRANDSSLSDVKKCLRDKGTHMIITPYIIGYNFKESVVLTHACGLVINKCNKTVELYDPNGYYDHEQVYKDWDYSFFRDIRILGRQLRGYTFLKHSESCPSIGFKHTVSDNVYEGMCSIWSIFLLHLRIIHHNIDARSFSKLVDKIIRDEGEDYFADFIKKYTSYIYPLILKLK